MHGLYASLGLLGVPVFASGGGPSYVLQPTFGYLLGFVVQAWLCGRYARRVAVSFRSLLLVNLLGMAVVYLLGISWFYVFSNFVLDAPIALWAAIFYCGILQALAHEPLPEPRPAACDGHGLGVHD